MEFETAFLIKQVTNVQANKEFVKEKEAVCLLSVRLLVSVQQESDLFIRCLPVLPLLPDSAARIPLKKKSAINRGVRYCSVLSFKALWPF